MKKHLIILMSLFSSVPLFSQVGINTEMPHATLDVVASPGDNTKIDGIIAPRLTGDELKEKDALYTVAQKGALIYATAAVTSASTKTVNITVPGYYYFDGTVWVALKSLQTTSEDATRFLGGTIYVRFQGTGNSIPTGTLSNTYVINAGSSSYNVGTLSVSPSKGGINNFKGSGFTISNPSSGIFDIKFTTPYTNIYGISVNILDSYGQVSSVSNGANPNSNIPGSALKTTDNSQVAYIGNDIIRIKTGNADGILSNRSFTFMVTGK